MTAVLNGYGAATTVRALDRILEVAQGDKKGGALTATAKGDASASLRNQHTHICPHLHAALEAWTHEQVLGWLDCIGLARGCFWRLHRFYLYTSGLLRIHRKYQSRPRRILQPPHATQPRWDNLDMCRRADLWNRHRSLQQPLGEHGCHQRYLPKWDKLFQNDNRDLSVLQ